MKSIKIQGTSPYTSGNEPHQPEQHHLWVSEEGEHLKVLIWVDDRWCIVTNMEDVPDSNMVEISYDDSNNLSEEFELQDYQYRIGVL